MRQSSLPNSIVLDCFAGGGTILKAAVRNGRKWIGIDKSDVSIKTIKSTIDSDYTFIVVLTMTTEEIFKNSSKEMPISTTTKKKSSNKRKTTESSDKSETNRQ